MASSSSSDSGWLIPLTLIVKCGGDATDILPIAAALLLFFAATSLLYWSSPGGPAWGKHHYAQTLIKLRYSSVETSPSPSPSPLSSTIPGPRGLPLIGSMDLMSGLSHRKLAAFATVLGAHRLMAFSIGATRAIVTADPAVAREILNGPDFADRPANKQAAYGLMFGRAIGFAPSGAYWRTLRRVAAVHLLSPRQVAATGPHRRRIAADMAAELRRRAGGPVTPREILKLSSLSNVVSSVFGREYGDLAGAGEEAAALKGLVEEGYELLGLLNWSDHLPFLSRFDPQRVRFRCSRLVPRVNKLVSAIVDDHRRRRHIDDDDGGAAAPEAEHQLADFVDVLLSLQGADRLSDADMIAVLWEMIFRGTDTVAVLIEWILARITEHREAQEKAHEELDRVVGRHHEVTESHVGSLVYLAAVIKEVLRMHPPGPLLSWARLATRDTCVDGRPVPAGTVAMVNMWAITHDPSIWEDPLEFRPDRFLRDGQELIGVQLGSDLRLAPFGSGRRSCPGKALAMATVGFWVATILHEFEWIAVGDVDMSEVLKLSCEMAVPLTVKLRPRRSFMA